MFFKLYGIKVNFAILKLYAIILSIMIAKQMGTYKFLYLKRMTGVCIENEN